MWSFGDAALPETERLSAALRRVGEVALALEASASEQAALAEVLEGAAEDLAGALPGDLRPRIGRFADGDGRLYLDHSRHIGRYDPAFPLYELDVAGDRATGRARFGLLHEGPPGCVHGGFLAVLFDQVVQHHNCDLGVAGRTVELGVQYHSAAPLLVDLAVEVERRETGRWIDSTATLRHRGRAGAARVCATASVRSVTDDPGLLPAVGPRRPG